MNASQLKPGDEVRKTAGAAWLGKIVQVHDAYEFDSKIVDVHPLHI
jgi:hypothetical protein